MDNTIHNRLLAWYSKSVRNKTVTGIQAASEGILITLGSFPLFCCLNPELPFIFPMRQHATARTRHGYVAGQLQHHLNDTRLVSIEKPVDDRYFILLFSTDNGSELKLYYQAFPRSIDLILFDDKEVLYSLSGDSEIPQIKQLGDPDGHKFSLSLEERLESNVLPEFSPEYRDLLQATWQEDKATAFNALKSLLKLDFDLRIVEDGKSEVNTLYPDLPVFPQEGDIFSDLDRAVPLWFGREARRLELSRLIREISGALKNWKKRNKRALKKIEQEEQAHEDKKTAGNIGDLILANMHTYQRGATSLEVEDLYAGDGSKLIIEIDPTASLQENAQRYYRRAGKARRAETHISERRTEINSEQSEIEELLNQLQESEQDLKMLRKLHGQLSDKGLIGNRGQNRKQQKAARPGRRFRHNSGARIVVGRNNTDNDTVTFKVANDMDFWLHAAGMPGSHVILRNPDRRDEPEPRQLALAASLAAWYSKGRNSSNVQVHWTQRRFVKKLKGGQPGKVMLKNYSSIVVNPAKPTTLEVDE